MLSLFSFVIVVVLTFVFVPLQLIKFSAQNNYDPGQIVKILLEIQSENKLQKIFNTSDFDAMRILKHTISHSLQAMLQTFRNNCIQYNPHIHYMRPNPLARVSLAQLMTRIVEEAKQSELHHQQQHQHQRSGNSNIKNNNGGGSGGGGGSGSVNGNDNKATVTQEPTGITSGATTGGTATHHSQPLYLLPIHLCEAVIALMENIKQIEVTALIYIESKFIDKFLSEHLLRPEHVTILVRFIGLCCQWLLVALGNNRPPSWSMWQCHEQRSAVTVVLRCIDILLHQKFIWSALNQQQPTLVKAMPPPPPTGCSGDGGVASSAGSTMGGVGGSDAPSTTDAAWPPLTKCELNTIICSLLDVVSLAGTLLLENTQFYKKYKNALRSEMATATATCPTSIYSITIPPATPQQYLHQPHHHHHHHHSTSVEDDSNTDQGNFENVAWLTAKYNPKAIFLGKLIETKIGNYDKGICFGEYYNYATTSGSASSWAGAAFTFGGTSSSGSSSSSGGLGISGPGSLSATSVSSTGDAQDLKGINNQFDFISLVSFFSQMITQIFKIWKISYGITKIYSM